MPSNRIVRPNRRSMRSVWSRENRSPTMRTVAVASRVASKMADFTCADAISSVKSPPAGDDMPRTVAGRRPSFVVTVAPSVRSGRATRSIGRRRSDASPSKRAAIPRPAHRPSSKRVVVPELRASIVSSGSRSSPPVTTRSSPRSSTCAPSARIAASVARTSAPRLSAEMRDAPRAAAAMMSARCEIDLSPATRTSPRRGPRSNVTALVSSRR